MYKLYVYVHECMYPFESGNKSLSDWRGLEDARERATDIAFCWSAESSDGVSFIHSFSDQRS